MVRNRLLPRLTKKNVSTVRREKNWQQKRKENRLNLCRLNVWNNSLAKNFTVSSRAFRNTEFLSKSRKRVAREWLDCAIWTKIRFISTRKIMRLSAENPELLISWATRF